MELLRIQQKKMIPSQVTTEDVIVIGRKHNFVEEKKYSESMMRHKHWTPHQPVSSEVKIALKMNFLLIVSVWSLWEFELEDFDEEDAKLLLMLVRSEPFNSWDLKWFEVNVKSFFYLILYIACQYCISHLIIYMCNSPKQMASHSHTVWRHSVKHFEKLLKRSIFAILSFSKHIHLNLWSADNIQITLLLFRA